MFGAMRNMAAKNAFIMSVETTSSPETFTLPLANPATVTGAGPYNFTVNWGDGSFSTITAYNDAALAHSYTTAGTYDISITGKINGLYFADTGDKAKAKEVKRWGPLELDQQGSCMTFYGCSNLIVTATDVPHIAGTDINLGYMFRGCSTLTTVPNMNYWNITPVINLHAMFYHATNFNEDISGWDVSNVYEFGYVVSACNNFDQDLSSWDVSSGTMMNYMLAGTVGCGDISGWDTSLATNMSSMFAGSTSFNEDISGWETGNVTTMLNMFSGCTAFNQNISGWDVSKVEDMAGMFLNATAFNQNISGWDVSSCESFRSMFAGIGHSFNQPIGSWTTTSLTGNGLEYTFQNNQVFDQDLSNWSTGNVTSMRACFQNADAWDQSLASWDVTSVTSMLTMFNDMSFSTANYDATLNGWAAQAVQSGVQLDAPYNYYSAAGQAAHDYLTGTKGWTINDKGLEP